jgi:hypothetical protein
MHSTELVAMWEGFKEDGLTFAAVHDYEDNQVILIVHSTAADVVG